MKMVDRASPPSDAELATLHSNGIEALGLYVGGVNDGGRAWHPDHAAKMRAEFHYILPIYVGENTCDGCKTPVTLTAAQGEVDGNDAVACAKRYGFAAGPIALDVEYDTYRSNVAGALAYMEAWSFAVRDGGYLPVHYAILQTATDYVPQPGHPTGLWIANWDGVGDLTKFPHADRFAGIGWQYADNWMGFDISNVDGAWWQTLAPQPAVATDDRILVSGNPLGPFGYRLGFRARLETIAKAISPNDIDAGVLSVAGWAREDEWQGVDGCSYQRCERCTLQYTPNTAAPWDIVWRPVLAGVLPAKRP